MNDGRRLVFRVVLQERRPEPGQGWRTVRASRAFDRTTLDDYDGLAIRVDLEGMEGTIRDRLSE